MASFDVPVTSRGFGQTSRRDAWWLQSVATFLGLSAFVVYSTWAAFQGEHYSYQGYLSPFYSPELFGPSHHSWFGPQPAWWPLWLPFSPALLILWAPGGFRMTCYYYRGAYYKAFWGAPTSCAVYGPHNAYSGERSFPLIMQNVHRYFLYLALAFILVLAYDVYKAMWFVNAETGATEFGIGVGTLVLAVNVIFLGSYTFGCHSLRHLVGGGRDILSSSPLALSLWKRVTWFNGRHMRFAWFSLFWVGFSDLYVRLCSMGIWTDWRIL